MAEGQACAKHRASWKCDGPVGSADSLILDQLFETSKDLKASQERLWVGRSLEVGTEWDSLGRNRIRKSQS